ncbi:hypothetical protein GOP47_0001018 [Adiantum capillus-veneris]|uniref:Uncharacterized protein n=1 Tax=Adiantum capillus-veneris TaxID=13818 RepID=A0A9D4ZR29_ADICA|nr:hypothetical protein GOP47_0001018 [Adiantum capillus-veneris]
MQKQTQKRKRKRKHGPKNFYWLGPTLCTHYACCVLNLIYFQFVRTLIVDEKQQFCNLHDVTIGGLLKQRIGCLSVNHLQITGGQRPSDEEIFELDNHEHQGPCI